MPRRSPQATSDTLTALARKRRWTPDEVGTVLEALRRAGDEPESFAARHGIPLTRLQRWTRPGATRAPATAPVRFAELALAGIPARDAAAVRIDLTTDRVEVCVLVPERCPPSWVAALAAQLRGLRT